MYVGDGNNMVNSWMRLAVRFNFEFICLCPPGCVAACSFISYICPTMFTMSLGGLSTYVPHNPRKAAQHGCMFVLVRQILFRGADCSEAPKPR